MRLFIAINLSSHVKAALAEMQSTMRRQGVHGNFTNVDNLHLTLAFIGEYKDPDTVLEVIRAVPFQPFVLSLDGFGNFGNLYWAGIESCDGLSAYVKRLRRALADYGIPFDRKKFSPHITLLRKAVTKHGLPRIQPPAARMEVREISLMRSDRTKGGIVYTEVGTVSCDCF